MPVRAMLRWGQNCHSFQLVDLPAEPSQILADFLRYPIVDRVPLSITAHGGFVYVYYMDFVCQLPPGPLVAPFLRVQSSIPEN